MIQRFAQTLKSLRLGEVAIRPNPLLYAQARDQLRALERAPADERRQWDRKQLAQMLWCSPDGVRLTGIDHFQREMAHLVRIQVIQESVSEVRILALTTPAFGAEDEAHLARNIRKKLPASMRVVIERSDRLERTSLGKTPFVIHRAAVKALLEGAVHGART